MTQTDYRTSGSLDSFESDWERALATPEARWFSYPQHPPTTQTELFEWVKAQQIDALLASHAPPGGRVLEYGCGSAGMSIYLANRGYETFAVDLAFDALRVARLNAEKHGSPQRFYRVCSDTFKLPFADATFDVVMSYGLLEHFEPETALPAMLTEVLRVLKPGGLFIADIVPGIGRFSVRTLGVHLSYAAAWVVYSLRGSRARLRTLRRDFYEHMYETTMHEGQWAQALERVGLQAVQVRICRPFPPLSISGGAERAYVGVLRALMGFWRWFDRARFPGKRCWGWMYLSAGVRPQ